MLTATVNGLSSQTREGLKRLLDQLAMLPFEWGPYKMANAIMVHDNDVLNPVLWKGLVLVPSSLWFDAQNLWSDVVVETSEPHLSFVLDDTVGNAKKKIIQILQNGMGQTVTPTPLPPTAPQPTLPVPPLVEDLVDPYTDSPTAPSPTTPSPMPPVPPPLLASSPSWPYWLAGGVGLAGLVALLVKHGTGRNIQTVNGLRGRKIRGTFCESELAPKRDFDPSSFRWTRTGRAWLLVGCPKGEWDKRDAWCRVGTRGYRLLSPVDRGDRCLKREKRVTK